MSIITSIFCPWEIRPGPIIIFLRTLALLGFKATSIQAGRESSTCCSFKEISFFHASSNRLRLCSLEPFGIFSIGTCRRCVGASRLHFNSCRREVSSKPPLLLVGRRFCAWVNFIHLWCLYEKNHHGLMRAWFTMSNKKSPGNVPGIRFLLPQEGNNGWGKGSELHIHAPAHHKSSLE